MLTTTVADEMGASFASVGPSMSPRKISTSGYDKKSHNDIIVSRNLVWVYCSNLLVFRHKLRL